MESRTSPNMPDLHSAAAAWGVKTARFPHLSAGDAWEADRAFLSALLPGFVEELASPGAFRRFLEDPRHVPALTGPAFTLSDRAGESWPDLLMVPAQILGLMGYAPVAVLQERGEPAGIPGSWPEILGCCLEGNAVDGRTLCREDLVSGPSMDRLFLHRALAFYPAFPRKCLYELVSGRRNTISAPLRGGIGNTPFFGWLLDRPDVMRLPIVPASGPLKRNPPATIAEALLQGVYQTVEVPSADALLDELLRHPQSLAHPVQWSSGYTLSELHGKGTLPLGAAFLAVVFPPSGTGPEKGGGALVEARKRRVLEETFDRCPGHPEKQAEAILKNHEAAELLLRNSGIGPEVLRDVARSAAVRRSIVPSRDAASPAPFL